MSELKPCPMCGNPLEIVHRNGSKYAKCTICIFETARHGYHISDDELIRRCNRRTAEDAKDKEIERLKAEVTRYRRALHDIKEVCKGKEYWHFMHDVIIRIEAELDK